MTAKPVNAIDVRAAANVVENRRIVTKLPGVLNTELLKVFFENTADDLFQPEVSERVVGYIGDTPTYYDSTTDFYVYEPTKTRREHQLEPTLISVDPDTGDITNIMFYDDIINLLRFQGGLTNNIDRLFKTQTYAWMPPINPDMLMNYTNYFWFPSGPDVIRFSTATDIGNFIGTSDSVTIEGITFTNGMRVQFTQDVNILYNDRVFVVSGIGTAFMLSTDGELGTSGWDDVTIGWDDDPWDGIENQITISAENQDYIVMERGASDNNAWSVRNRWYHRDELTESQLAVALEYQAVRPIIEFKKNIELYNHGTYGRQPVTVRDDVTTDPEVQIIGQPNYTIDGIDVRNGDTILFTNAPSLQGIWGVSGWDFEDPGAVGVTPLTPPHPQYGNIGFEWASGTFDPFFNISYSGPPADISITEVSGQAILVSITANFLGLGFTPGMKVTINGTTANDGTYTIDDIDISGAIITFVEPLINSGDVSAGSVTIVQAVTEYQNRVFRVGGVGEIGGITLTLVTDGQNSDGSPADGDQVKILLGLIHQNKEYYWSDAEDFWIEAQIKETTNQMPLFQLYDTQAVKLQDPGEYPLSNFAGNEIFSFQINDNPSQALDSVLELPLVYNNFGEIIFENHLVTNRYTYNSPTEEITGFYFYKIHGTNSSSDVYENAWYLKDVESKQFIIDPFTITDVSQNEFLLSVEPTDLTTIQIFVDGVEDTTNTWTLDERIMTFATSYTSGQLVRIKYYSTQNIPEGVDAIYEIPINLSANADNEEVDFIANSEYFDHFTSVISNQPNLIGTPNGANNWRNTGQDRSLGEDILQHRSPLLKLLTLGSNRNIDFMLSVRYVEREYTRFRNKFLRKLAEFNKDGIHNDSQDPSVWIEDALTSINLGKILDFPFSLSGMGTRENGEPTYYPSSPSRLGIFGVYKPEKYLDTSYITPRNVIQMHDGSIMLAYDDFRDDVILAFENNVYDTIPDNYKTEYTPDFDWTQFVTTKYHTGDYSVEEFNRLLTPILQRWAVFNTIDLHTNTIYSPTDPFTWNYGAQGVPGYWRGIYKFYYETDRPNTHPWEMFGFSQKPDWWELRYGTAPYASSNPFLWADMAVGRIADGPRAGVYERYARPGAPIPVNGAGELLDPVSLGVVYQPGILDAKADWKIGDHGPAETVFRRSEMWSFAVAQISYLMKPAKFIELGWDAIDNTFVYSDQVNPQWVNTVTRDRPRSQELYVHGEVLSDGTTYLSDGIQQWITNYLTSNGQSITNIFGNAIRDVKVQLAHKMAGYINTNSFRALADNFGLVPDENIDILLYNSPSIREEFYSGVIIERVGNGWSVFGYDALKPSFTMKLPVKTSRQIPINVGTLRVLESTQHREATKEIPYGTVFSSRQEVYDFLVGYGEFLKTRGWVFDNFDYTENQNNDWRLAGKQFLFWTQGNWEVGSLLTVSPLAEQIKFTADHGFVANIESIINGVYSLLDRSGSLIQPEDTFVTRDGSDVIITPQNDRYIFSARLYVIEYEHVMAFDNQTIFDDLIYSPLLNLRQSRFKLFVTRAGAWAGKYNAPGYFISGNTLTPNFEKTTNDIRRYFDIEDVVERPALQDTARRVIGFQTRDYLDGLNLSENTQLQFYQGFIRQKGTPLVIDKLFRSDFTTDSGEIQIFEEWAFRVGEYGATKKTTTIEFLLSGTEWRSDPQMIEFINDTVAGQSDNPYDDVIEIRLDDPRWVLKPPYQSLVNFEYRPPVSLKRSRNAAYLYRTDIKVAGYPLDTEVRFHVNSIDDRNAIFNTQKITVEAEDLAFGDLVWVDDIGNFYSINDPDDVYDDSVLSQFNFSFMVYRYTDTGLTFSIPVLPAADEGTLIVTNAAHGFIDNQYVMIDSDSGTDIDINSSYIVSIPTEVTGTSFATLPTLNEGMYITINGTQLDIICDTIDEIVDLLNTANISNIRAYNSGGQITIVDVVGENIVIEVGSPASVIGSVGGTYSNGQNIVIDSISVSLDTGTATIVGVNNPTYIKGQSIKINGTDVILTGTTVDEAIDDINNATISPSVTAYKSVSGLAIKSSSEILLEYGSTVVGLVGATYSDGDDVLINSISIPLSLYVEVIGSIGATYTNSETIIINGNIVTLSTGTTVADAVTDITAASIVGITAIDDGGALKLYSTTVDITLAEGSGTALVDLGFTAGLYTRATDVNAAVYYINEAVISNAPSSIDNIVVINESNALKIYDSMGDNIELTEGSGTALADLGFTEGLITALTDFGLSEQTVSLISTLDDAVTDINNAAITDVTAINNGNALQISKTSGTLIIAEGSGTAAADLGLPISSFDNVLTEMGLTAGTYSTKSTDSFIISTSITRDDNTSTHPGTIGIFTESRFATIADRDSAQINSVLGAMTFVDGDYVYVDTRDNINDIMPLWEVYQWDGSTWNIAVSDEVNRTQSLRIDSELISQAVLYNNDSNLTDARLSLYDPAKGFFPSQATSEIAYRVEYDPAKYTNGDETTYQVDPLLAWGEEQVGKVWWDLSTVEYLNYEQGSDRQRRNNWGKILPGKSIDIYEWVKSPVLPTDWASYVETNADQPPENFDYKPSGEAYQADISTNPPYTEQSETDIETGTTTIYYYFWVKNSETVPSIKNRDFSVARITRTMTNPTFEGVPWFAPISSNFIIVSGVEQFLTTSNSILQINYNNIKTDINLHREWVLSREGDESDVPTDRFWNKMRDSLVGFDLNNNPVPDPNLEQSRRIGNFIRPRQTWFMDREAASPIFIDAFNTLVGNQCIADERPNMFDHLNDSSTPPTEYDGIGIREIYEYDYHVADNIERNALVTNSIISIGEQVWVDGIIDTLNFWKVYVYNGIDPITQQPIFDEILSESYKVSDFWEAIDYYADGFSTSTIVDLTVDTILERNALPAQIEGTIVQVNDSNSDNTDIWAWYEYTTTDLFNPWVLVAKQGCTIRFDSSLIIDSTYGNVDLRTGLNGRDEALKVIIDAMRNDILTDLEQNLLFYTMVRYVFSEQSLVDWVFKTSYILAVGLNASAEQNPVLTTDPTSYLIDFINEARPYHTKLRDFIVNQNFGTDSAILHVTDFDKPALYDSLTDTTRVLDPSVAADVAIMSDPDSEQYDWYTNYLLSSENIRTNNVTLLFDRVSCDASAGWDNLFGWDFGANEDWDLTSFEINETAADRIIRLYNPQPLSLVDVTFQNIDPIKNITETKDIESLISGCNFQGTIVDGAGLVIDIDQIDTFLSGGPMVAGAPINPDDIIVDGNLFIQPSISANHPEELVISAIGESVKICTNTEAMYEVVGTDITGATYNNGETIIINGVTITLSSGVFPEEAVTDIRNAANNAASGSPIAPITAYFDGNVMRILSTAAITVNEGSGTALVDLGFSDGQTSVAGAPNTAFYQFLNNVDARNAEDIAPFATAILDVALLNTDTEITVVSIAGLPLSGTIIVMSFQNDGTPHFEFIEYDDIDEHNLIGLTRTNPSTHPAGSRCVVLDFDSPQIATWESYRVNDSATTTLAADFKVGDTEMVLSAVAGLPKQKTSETYMKIPGVIWIENERIEFYQRDGTTLKYIRRGTAGTSSGIPFVYDINGDITSSFATASVGDIIYPAGTRVIDGTQKQAIPGGYEWRVAPGGYQSLTTSAATFLKNGPGTC